MRIAVLFEGEKVLVQADRHAIVLAGRAAQTN